MWWWGILFWCGGLAVVGLTVVRIVAQIQLTSVVVEALTPAPDLSTRLTLSDPVAVEQRLRVPAGRVTRVAVGVANVRDASPDARVIVSLLDDRRDVLASEELAVASFWNDELTPVPITVRIPEERDVVVRLASRGVSAAQALAVFYEKDATAFQDGSAVRIRDITADGAGETRRTLPGNIAVRLYRDPTIRVVGEELLRSWRGLAGIGAGLGLIVCWLLGPTRRWIVREFERPLVLPVNSVRRAHVVLWAIVGMGLATFVTFPIYQQRSQLTTMGDVHRALIYRAVGRTALLHDRAFALWEPHLCGGTPLLANAESAHADPFFLFPLLLEENLGARVSVTATLALGFVGAALLAARFAAATPLAALSAGGLFAFSGFAMLMFANGNYAYMPLGWVPWATAAFLESLRRASAAPFAALFLGFLFLGGSVHLLAYTLFSLAFLAFFLGVLHRRGRPGMLLLLTAVLALALTAFKAFPAVEAQTASTFQRPPAFVPPWSWVPKMFWDRRQFATPQWRFEETGENFRWIEYGSYVGGVPVLIFLGALPFFLRSRPAMAGTALAVFPMIYGSFLWPVLARAPVLDEVFRNPQRLRVIFLLWFGVAVAFGLSYIARRVGPRSRAVIALLVGGILLDLVTIHRPLHGTLYTLPVPPREPRERFVRLTDSYTEGAYYRAGYLNYRANEGTTDLCIPYLLPSHAVSARGADSSNPERPYRGEAFLTGPGTAEIVQRIANRMRVRISAARDTRVVLNQNFFPGWMLADGRRVDAYEGLVSARVSPDDTLLVFQYRPWSFLAGLSVTAVTVLALAAATIARRRRSADA